MDPFTTPERSAAVPPQREETPTPIASGDANCQGGPKRQLAVEQAPAFKRQRVLDPVKEAAKAEAKAEAAQQKKAEKEASNAAKAEEKKAAKDAASAAKETERRAREIHKMIGDVLKSKLKGKKKRVDGRRTYSVPGGTVSFECVSPSDFERLFSRYDVKSKRGGAKILALRPGQMQEIFGKTKCKGGSMYATFEISSANVTYEPVRESAFNHGMLLKITYKTRESGGCGFW